VSSHIEGITCFEELGEKNVIRRISDQLRELMAEGHR